MSGSNKTEAELELDCLYGEMATIFKVQYKPKSGESRAAFWIRQIGEALIKEGKNQDGYIHTISECDLGHTVNAMSGVVDHPTIAIMKGLDGSLDLALTKLKIWRNNMRDHQPSELAKYKDSLKQN